MSAHDVETIRAAYEEFANGDAAAVLARLDASVEWIEMGGGDSPSGAYIGPEAVGAGVIAVIGANFDEYHVDPSGYTDEGDRVVVTGRFKGMNKGGAELDIGFTHTFDMRDGKVVRFENRPDDADAWAAGWTS
jgi:ketosteroid isomerase-like protein